MAHSHHKNTLFLLRAKLEHSVIVSTRLKYSWLSFGCNLRLGLNEKMAKSP